MPRDALSWSRRARARSAIGEHWLGFVFVGGVQAAFGLLAIVAGLLLGGSDPGILSLFVGGLLLVAASVHVALGVLVGQPPARLLVNSLLGVVYIAAGVMFLAEPYLTAVQFDPLIVAFVVVHGLTVTVFGLWVRPVPYWYTVVAGGLVSVLVGFTILNGAIDGRKPAVTAFGFALLLVGVSLVLVAYGGRFWTHPLARGGWL